MTPKEPWEPKVGTTQSLQGGDREVRQVPFTKDMFREVCQGMFVCGSIARTISRADVPVFSRASVKLSMEESMETGALGSTQATGIFNPPFPPKVAACETG